MQNGTTKLCDSEESLQYAGEKLVYIKSEKKQWPKTIQNVLKQMSSQPCNTYAGKYIRVVCSNTNIRIHTNVTVTLVAGYQKVLSMKRFSFGQSLRSCLICHMASSFLEHQSHFSKNKNIRQNIFRVLCKIRIWSRNDEMISFIEWITKRWNVELYRFEINLKLVNCRLDAVSVSFKWSSIREQAAWRNGLVFTLKPPDCSVSFFSEIALRYAYAFGLIAMKVLCTWSHLQTSNVFASKEVLSLQK